MDLARIEQHLRAKIWKLYSSKFPTDGAQVDVPNFEADMKRLRQCQKRLRNHMNFMRDRAKRLDTLERCRADLRLMRHALENGHLLMALDIERSYTEIIQEIGVTVYQNGQFTSHNLRIENTPPRHDRYHFGESETISWDAAKNVVLDYAKDAQFYIGHSLIVDFEHMKAAGLILPKRPFMDTFWLSHLVEGKQGAKLRELAAHHDVEAPVPHCGGNDARYNMELVLAMIEKYV